MTPQVEHFIDLVITLTQKEFKVRYKSSFLGYLWSVLNPLAFAMVFYVALGIMLRVKVENYLIFLLAGLFPWQWFSNSTISGTSIFLANGALVKKVSFSRHILNLVLVLQDGIHFLLTIPIFIIFKYIKGFEHIISLDWIYGVPILFITGAALLYGTTLFLGSLNLFFRDIQNLIAILVNLLFYCTPILYPLEKVPEKYQSLMLLNPLASYFSCWRELLLNNIFAWELYLYTIIFTVVALLLGILTYRRLSPKFAEVL